RAATSRSIWPRSVLAGSFMKLGLDGRGPTIKGPPQFARDRRGRAPHHPGAELPKCGRTTTIDHGCNCILSRKKVVPIGGFVRNLSRSHVTDFTGRHLGSNKVSRMGKILLCDDEDTLLRSLGRILRTAGHDVVTADGPGGYAKLQQERFDMVLTDIRMP